MSLRQLLTYAHENDAVTALADAARAADGPPERAFVSASLRPYLLAALLDEDPQRPALVVSGDDRAARDLAADLKAFLAPRLVRFYPARGVRYESPLAPPPHLVGLRVAALEALSSEPGEEGAAVVVASAGALAEKVPDPELRPQGFAIEKSELLDLEETASRLAACGYERIDQVEERGQFALRGDILDVYPATEERAVRCELFDVEVERLTFFSTFTQRSLEEVDRVEIEPCAEIGPEQRELAEIAAAEEEGERPDVADILPVDRFCAFLPLVPDDALVAIAAEEEIDPSLADLWQDVSTSFHDQDAHHLYLPPDELRLQLDARAVLSFSSLAQAQPHDFRAQGADTSAKNLREAEPELEKLVRSGYRTVVAWARRGEAERAAYNLARVQARFLDGKPAPHEPGVTFAAASLREGFLAPGLKLAVLPEHRLLRRRRAERPAGPATGAGAIASFTDLRASDAVVHEDHGIARFTGFRTREVGGITRDYLELEYKDGDNVFVPSDQLHKISRYVGADATDPPLSKLGGKQWEQMKIRARRAAQALAGELINLYAERRRRAGHAFPQDSDWQIDFENAFPYTETPDQMEAIEEVNAAVKDFQEGRVDILIGTHRLLSRDVRPKDLGLLIVDEEQRFGVKQKELLRQLRLRVDVLSLSATPIPRTLQMSLAGLRDISVIETPPEGRRPVRTYVGEYDEELVKQAIQRELARGGQVFFLHNRVETIDETAERVRAICPNARVRVAHGQMAEGKLEKVMMEFVRGDADVLVCTTIVEAGLDIPTAHTPVVERAHMLRLAPLYQIRRRVGPRRQRAYAYLFYPSRAALTEDAAARLSTLSDYTELRSGFKIAMRDLEIRGAGNLLGDEQSGHVAAIGFELYVAMLDEAVAALAGTSADEAPEPVRVDVPVDAFVPGAYVPYEAAKIEIHRRVAGAREVAELILLREELEDRFGPIPEPLENLIKLQDARIKLGRAGARRVDLRGGRMRVTPIELDSKAVKELRAELPDAVYESGRSTVVLRMPDEADERFGALVEAAEVVLKVASEPRPNP